ncbi:MAG: hypothetical protein JXA09_06725 [Anaerolineae bacterium]|nr:hypothetical protein [Anaerolineae bacterium]
MDYMHPDLRHRMEGYRRREAEAYAANWRLLHQSRPARPNPLSQGGCWLLCQLGRLLVWSGQRLEQSGAMRAA